MEGESRECEAAAEAKRINRIEKTIMYFILDKRKIIINKGERIEQYKKRR